MPSLTATDPEEDQETYPQGIRWYGLWQSADYFLPRSCHLPVQVDLGHNTFEFRITTRGDWRKVTRWRKVQMTQGAIRRLRKALKIEQQEIDAEG